MPTIINDAAEVIAEIIRREGCVYTDTAGDRGGPTKFGITLSTLQTYSSGATITDLQALDIGVAHDIYSQAYVAPFGNMPEPLLGLCVDCAVQHGLGRTHMWLG